MEGYVYVFREMLALLELLVVWVVLVHRECPESVALADFQAQEEKE